MASAESPPRPRRGIAYFLISSAAWGGLIGAIVLACVHRWLFPLDEMAAIIGEAYCIAAGVVFALLGKLLGRMIRPRWARILVGVLILVPLGWLTTDLLHSILIKRSYANWNAQTERDANGVRLECREYTLGDGDTALLLVHGFADSGAIYVRMAPALAAIRSVPVIGRHLYTVRVMRLSHSATPFDDYKLSNADEWSRGVGEELAELRKKHKKVVVIAHSLGAAVVLDRLSKEPKSADAVVLLGPLIDVSTIQSPILSPHAWFELLTHLLVFTDRVSARLRLDLHDDAAIPLAKGDRYVSTAIYKHIFDLIERNRGKAAQMKLPLLMILAREDKVIDNKAAQAYLVEWTHGTSSPTSLRFLERPGHMIPIDYEWETAVTLIDQFVRGLPGP